MLNEFKESDNAWLNQQMERSNSSIRSATVTFPSWQIVSQKWIRLQYEWATGEVTVVLEQHPNKSDAFTGIRMTQVQWEQLVALIPYVQEYIRYAETGQSWQALALFRGHPMTESKGVAAQVRIRIFDMTFLTITALDEAYKGGCQVDVREFVFDKNNCHKLIPIRRGLTLIGGGFDYLGRFLVPRVNAGIKMYEAIHEHSTSFLDMCFIRSQTPHQEEEELDEMPEPFKYINNHRGATMHQVDWSSTVPPPPPPPEPSQFAKFY